VARAAPDEGEVKSLKTFPDRCHKAPEATALGEDVRHLIVGNYRLIFAIQAETVTVLHIRHGARLPAGTAAPRVATSRVAWGS